MKKIILTVFTAFAFLTSCQDAYEIDQPGMVTNEDQVYTDVASVKMGVMGIYNYLMQEDLVKFETVFTDEVAPGVQNGGAGINDGSYNFRMVTDNNYAENIWYRHYRAINNINRMFGVIDRLERDISDSTKLNDLKNYKGQLFGLRAYCNLVLFSYFTPDYTNPSGLSIMKFDFVHDGDLKLKLPRASVAEIKSFIEDDVELANKSYFETQPYNVANNKYITKGALDAIIVKLNAMTGDYDKVIEYAEKFIGSGHSFATGDNYIKIFHEKDFYSEDDYEWIYGPGVQTNSSEIIFQLERATNQITSTDASKQIADVWYTNNIGSSGSVTYDIGRSLYNELDKLDPTKTNGPVYTEEMGALGVLIKVPVTRSDLRFTVNVLFDSKAMPNYSSLNPTAYRNSDLLYVGKYHAKPGTQRMQANMMVFRYTDIMLSLAEARAAKGQVTGSVADGDFSNVSSIIYNIRKARLNPESGLTEPVALPVISSAQSAWKAILNERRMEFAFEGHRYLDVKRIGVKANEGFKRDAMDCAINGACELAPNDYKMTLPIPRNEVLSNPNMVQNKGY